MLNFAENDVRNVSKEEALQAIIENSNINAAILYAQQIPTVVAVDLLLIIQNNQNNAFTTIQNTPYNYSTVELIQNSNYSYWYSVIGSFSTAGLILLNPTHHTTKYNSILQYQLLIMVQVKLTVLKSYECSALVESGTSFNIIS